MVLMTRGIFSAMGNVNKRMFALIMIKLNLIWDREIMVLMLDLHLDLTLRKNL